MQDLPSRFEFAWGVFCQGISSEPLSIITPTPAISAHFIAPEGLSETVDFPIESFVFLACRRTSFDDAQIAETLVVTSEPASAGRTTVDLDIAPAQPAGFIAVKVEFEITLPRRRGIYEQFLRVEVLWRENLIGSFAIPIRIAMTLPSE